MNDTAEDLIQQLMEMIAEQTETDAAIDAIAGKAPMREVLALVVARLVALERAVLNANREIEKMRQHVHPSPPPNSRWQTWNGSSIRGTKVA